MIKEFHLCLSTRRWGLGRIGTKVGWTTKPSVCLEVVSSHAGILKGLSQMAIEDVNQSIKEELAGTPLSN